MRRNACLDLAGLWILAATLVLTRLWLTRPEFFLQVPESFARWLIELYGSENGEELADLELWFCLTISFVVVTLATGLGWLTWRRVQGSLRIHSKFWLEASRRESTAWH